MGSASDLTKDQNLRMARGIITEKIRSRLEETKVREISRILGGVRNKGVIADVGCFDGSLSARYAKIGFARVDGFDISPEALDLAAKAGVNAILWNFESDSCPAADGNYDALVCSDTLEHVYNTQNVVGECFRVLKPGGTAVFLVPNLVSAYNRFLVLTGKMPLGSPGVSVSHRTEVQVNLGHARLGTSKEWQGLLTNGGFNVQRVSGIWSSGMARIASFSWPSLAHSLVYHCGKP